MAKNHELRKQLQSRKEQLAEIEEAQKLQRQARAEEEDLAQRILKGLKEGSE